MLFYIWFHLFNVYFIFENIYYYFMLYIFIILIFFVFVFYYRYCMVADMVAYMHKRQDDGSNSKAILSNTLWKTHISMSTLETDKTIGLWQQLKYTNHLNHKHNSRSRSRSNPCGPCRPRSYWNWGKDCAVARKQQKHKTSAI